MSVKPSEVPPAQPETPPWHRPVPDIASVRVFKQLQPRALDVAALLVTDYRNRDIGERLGLTEQLVKNYVRSIYDAMGVSNRIGAALWIMEHKDFRALLEAR